MPHIIIAEDEHTMRWMLAQIIQHAYPTACVSDVGNGHTALRLYEQRGADLVIADVYMPEMEGTELALRIRARSRYVLIILISGKLPIKDRLFEQTSLHILSKPFDKATLLQLVERVLDCRYERTTDV